MKNIAYLLWKVAWRVQKRLEELPYIYKTKPNSGHESEGMSQFVEEAPVLLSLQI